MLESLPQQHDCLASSYRCVSSHQVHFVGIRLLCFRLFRLGITILHNLSVLSGPIASLSFWYRIQHYARFGLCLLSRRNHDQNGRHFQFLRLVQCLDRRIIVRHRFHERFQRRLCVRLRPDRSHPRASGQPHGCLLHRISDPVRTGWLLF